MIFSLFNKTLLYNLLCIYLKAVIVKIIRSFDSSNYWVKDSSYSILLLLLLINLIETIEQKIKGIIAVNIHLQQGSICSYSDVL